jgi:two-component system, cell cycle response regulator DivK
MTPLSGMLLALQPGDTGMENQGHYQKAVLIVEKQPNYTQLLVKQVMFAGLRPLVAVTGEGGLRKAVELRPDLILLELDLSDMSGLKFVGLLKEQAQLKTMPIVAMSIFPYLKAAALYGGCDDFLQKPVKMIDLMNHIRHYLHSSLAPTALTRSVSRF